MSSQPRERKRTTARAPGLLRNPALPGQEPERPVQHGVRERTVSWRWLSGVMVVCLGGLLALFFTTPSFYVQGMEISGLRYTTREEVYTLANVAGTHLFWLDAEAIRTAILRSATIADARVTLGWPPQMVQVAIQEREPALIWQQSGVTMWVDVQGRVMQLREDLPKLLRIVAEPDSLDQDTAVPVDVVTGALQLKTLRPNIEVLQYNRVNGLGYRDGRGWDAWFGSGTDMPEKLVIYEAIVADLVARNIQPALVSVVNPDAPFYSLIEGAQ